jgi:hypothetical protein
MTTLPAHTQLHDEQRLTPVQTSQLTGLPVATLASDRCRKRGIPFEKLGHSTVRYRWLDIKEYLTQRRFTPA